MPNYRPLCFSRVKNMELHCVQRRECPYSEFFWSIFFDIRTEYRDLQSKSSHSVQMPEKKRQKNSEYEHFYAVLIHH